MLEIIALIFLTNKVGAVVGQKGYSTGWFKTMAAGLWFGGELAGAVIGTLATLNSGSPPPVSYIVALLGALLGAGIAIWLANYPVAAYRWWRVAAGLLAIAIFFVAALFDPNSDIAPRVTALSFFFISVMLGTLLYQDILDQQRMRAGLLGIAILSWVILAFGYAIAGLEFVNKNDWVSGLGLFAIAVSAVAILWSIFDAVRNASPLAALAGSPPGG